VRIFLLRLALPIKAVSIAEKVHDVVNYVSRVVPIVQNFIDVGKCIVLRTLSRLWRNYGKAIRVTPSHWHDKILFEAAVWIAKRLFHELLLI